MNETLVLEYARAQVEEKKINDIRIYIHNKDTKIGKHHFILN